MAVSVEPPTNDSTEANASGATLNRPSQRWFAWAQIMGRILGDRSRPVRRKTTRARVGIACHRAGAGPLSS